MLQLLPIKVDESYRKKFNCIQEDFFVLAKDDKILRDTLYRKGGFFHENDLEDDYFILLKQVEEYYGDNITTDPKRKPHLSNHDCIIDKHGNEKVVNDKLINYIYLVKNSVIYSINKNYYNIETGEWYCETSTSMQSNDFLFLENRWEGMIGLKGGDKNRRGVFKINKKTGEYEIFKGDYK